MGPIADLLSLTIDAVTDDGALAQVPVLIAQMLGGLCTPIMIRRPQGVAILAVHGAHPDLLRLYEEYFWTIDPWSKGVEEHGLVGMVPSDTFISEDAIVASEFYNDLLRPNEDMVRCLGSSINIGDGEQLMFSTQRARNRSLFEDQEIRLAQGVPPLLSRLAIGRRRLAQGRGRIAETLVDSEPDGVLVVDAVGQVRFANREAGRLRERGAPVYVEEGGLRAAPAAFDALVTRAIRWACTSRGGERLSSPHPDFAVAVDPLPEADTSLAVVRVRDLAQRREAELSRAATAFGLTPAEQALAASMMRGLTPAAHAHARGVSVETVRSQLRSLYGKAAVSTRAELILTLGA